MTLEQRITLLAQGIAADIKSLNTNQGSLASLTTTAKGSLVSAINELKTLVAGASSINDSAASTSTTASYSANKITGLIATAVTGILGSAGAAYDTLQELQVILQGDDTAISGLLTAVGNRIAFDAVQTLTTQQKLQACQNIGIGNPDVDLVTAYNTAKA